MIQLVPSSNQAFLCGKLGFFMKKGRSQWRSALQAEDQPTTGEATNQTIVFTADGNSSTLRQT